MRLRLQRPNQGKSKWKPGRSVHRTKVISIYWAMAPRVQIQTLKINDLIDNKMSPLFRLSFFRYFQYNWKWILMEYTIIHLHCSALNIIALMEAKKKYSGNKTNCVRHTKHIEKSKRKLRKESSVRIITHIVWVRIGVRIQWLCLKQNILEVNLNGI